MQDLSLRTRSAGSPLTAAATAHLARTVRVWLGLSDPTAAVPALPPELARQVLRLEEFERPTRDAWGCWDYTFSENYRAGTLRDAEIDRWVVDARRELSQFTTVEPLWPKGRFAVCITHDVDLVSDRSTLTQVLRSARAGLARGVDARGDGMVRLARPAVRVARGLRAGVRRAPSLRDTLERSAAIETRHGATASYFFTVPPWGERSRYDCVYAPSDRCTFRGTRTRIADVMTELSRNGFDVGLHGGYQAAFEPDALRTERNMLRTSELEIRTTRQHFLRWDVRTTPALQEAAALEVDSSLGFNANVGFRAGTSLPFHHFDVIADDELRLLEVPLIVEDTALFGPGGLNVDADEARRIVGALIDQAAALGTAITFLFHPDKLPRPEWEALFSWTLDYAEALDGWLTSLSDLAAWWTVREAAILAA